MTAVSPVKKTILCALAAPIFAISSIAMADTWGKCGGCHNGKTAPDKAALQQKHKTADSFIKAGKASKNPMMKAFQQNDADLKGAAADLGLK